MIYFMIACLVFGAFITCYSLGTLVANMVTRYFELRELRARKKEINRLLDLDENELKIS
jgi:hypothetical protein